MYETDLVIPVTQNDIERVQISRIMHTGGFTNEELMVKRTHVIANVLESMMKLLNAMHDLYITCDDQIFLEDAGVIEKNVKSFRESYHESLDETAAEAIKQLWAHPTIQRVYERRSEFHLPDCAK